MGRRKKQNNELDAILEQLKRSYGSDVDSELEDSLLEDEDSEEDTELASILAKIFSDDDIDTTPSVVTEQPKEQQPREEVSATIETEPEEEIKPDEPVAIDEPVDIDEPEVIVKEQAVAHEKQEVDSVLDAMLRGAALSQETSSEPQKSAVQEILSQENDIDEQTEQPTTEYEVETEIDIEVVQEIETFEQSLDDTTVEADEQPVIAEDAFADEYNQEDTAIEIEESFEEEYVDKITEDIAAEFEDTELEIEIFDEPDEEELLPEPHIVLDPNEYTADNLQLTLSDLDLIKFEDDFTLPALVVEANEVQDAPKDQPTTENTLDSEDVSLLVKFGYGDEVNSQIGRNKATKALHEKKASFVPEDHNVPFGYVGHEFTGSSNTKAIMNKYKQDRSTLSLMLIAISFFIVVSFTLGMIFEFSSDRAQYHLPMMALDILLVAISALICRKRIISGALAISRFEINAYSMLVMIGAEYLVYNIVTSIVYMLVPSLKYSSFMWVSASCVLTYFAVIALCDLMDCEKQMKAFELMTKQGYVYTAEKVSGSHTSDEAAKAHGYGNANTNAYKVRRGSMISGYFAKTSAARKNTMSPIYMLGIVPSIALALSCTSAIISENAVYGIHMFMMVSILCLPIPCMCLSPIVEFISARRYAKNGSAFIGVDAEEQYRKANLIIFDDTESIEVTSYKEINPSKNTGDVNEKLTIAYNVLKTLGGPLGEVVPDKRISDGEHELIINSISENGINVYFDSSTNILIGDRQYMLSHNLKVKTDVSLSTATRGADRSVIYMAFDGKPELGFVITGKIKRDFIEITSILNACSIAVSVESYEPEVNDTYFEQNKISDGSLLGVHKPSHYHEKIENAACDGSVIALDAVSLARAISECRGSKTRKKRIIGANIISLIIGILLSVAIAFVIGLDSSAGLLATLSAHPSIALYISVILCSVPAIINAVKEYIRK